MRFARAIWRLLVGIKDALVLIFMLLFFGALYAALGQADPDRRRRSCAGPRRSHRRAAVAGGSLRSAHRWKPREGISPARPDCSPRERQDRRPREGGRARPRRVHGRRPDGAVDLAEAIRDVRASGKPVLAYATGYTDDSYQLASAASEVWLNPLGVVGLAGPGGSRLYYRGLSTRWA